jgi:hypothetical protein
MLVDQGGMNLVDAETGEAREVSITPGLLARYKARLDEFCASLETLANRHGMDYVRTTTDDPFEDLLLKTLRSAGLLRA